MKKQYSYVDSHKSKNHGENYDRDIYSGDTYHNKVWHLEQVLLSTLLPDNKDINILDFACGTGRILSFLESRQYKHLSGIDVSESMLKEAKKKLSKSKLLNIDINDKNINIDVKEKFDFILAFRFFLNADPELRKETLINLKTLTKKNGILIFNIHGNKYSTRMALDLLRNIYKYLCNLFVNNASNMFRYDTRLSVSEINRLLNECKYEIKEVYSYSFIPESISNLISSKVWFKIEKHFVTKKFMFGTHLMYVCQKIND